MVLLPLVGGSYTDTDIIEAGYIASDLTDTYTPPDLSGAYTDSEIIDAGYTVELKDTYSPTDLSGTYRNRNSRCWLFIS